MYAIKKNRIFYAAVGIIFAAVFIFSGTMLVKNMTALHESKTERDELLKIMTSSTHNVVAEKNNKTEQDNNTKQDSNTEQDSGIEANSHTEQEAIQTAAPSEDGLKNLNELKEINEDFIGWISINNTDLSYPVMQSKSAPNFYLNHNFYKKESAYGTPYVQENCDISDTVSGNVIIHGHNMRNGQMFGVLKQYSKKNFYEKNNTIHFETVEGGGKYNVIGYLEVDLSESEHFRYYDYIDGDEQQFNDFIGKVQSLSFYKTNFEPVYGKQLLTLSTCHNKNNVRSVLVAQAM